MAIVQKNFFQKPALMAAKGLLGKILVRKYRNTKIKGLITEVEAYDGLEDKASHASHGLTPRTRVMFGPPGTWYVYFTYGMHWMLNVVVREEGYPAAVLIRGTDLASGPGRLTRKFKIDGRLNGKPVGRTSGLWIEDGMKIPNSKIKKSARVGVDYAGPVWAKKEWRLFIPSEAARARSGNSPLSGFIDAGYTLVKRNFAQDKKQTRDDDRGRGRKFKKP